MDVVFHAGRSEKTPFAVAGARILPPATLNMNIFDGGNF